MNTIIIRTVNYGEKVVNLGAHAVKCVKGGLWYGGLMQIAVYTRQDESAGYIVNFNCATGTKTLERLKCTYIDSESVKKYGRECVTVYLPLI